MRKMMFIFIILTSIIPNLIFAQFPQNIKVAYPAKVYIDYGQHFSIQLKDSTSEDKVQILFFDSIEQIDSTNLFTNAVYKISTDSNWIVINSSTGAADYINHLLVVRITLPYLKKLFVKNTSLVILSGEFNIDTLKIINQGASYIKIDTNITINNLILNNTGAGYIKLFPKDTIQTAEINISGAGGFSATHTPIKNLNALIEGASVCNVNVADTLKARVRGFSVLSYRGKPKYRKIISDGLVIIRNLD